MAAAAAAVLVVASTFGSTREAEAQRGGRIALGIGAGLLGIGLLAGAGRYYGGYGYWPDRYYSYRPYYRSAYWPGYYSAGVYDPRWASYNWGGRRFLYERFHRHVYYGDYPRSRYYSYPRYRGYRAASFGIGLGYPYWGGRRIYRSSFYGPRWRGYRNWDRGYRRAYYGPRRSGVRVRVRF